MAESIIQQVTNNSSSNYCKMPDGTLIQWGHVDKNYSAGTQGDTISYPMNFVGGYYADVNTTGYYQYNLNSAVSQVIVLSKNSGSMALRVIMTSATSLSFNWIAIGRWK